MEAARNSIVENGIVENAIHRSVSQLNTYTACQQRYYFGRVLRLRRSPAAWSIQGSAVHAAVELWEKSGRQASMKDLLNIFEETWDRLIGEARRREPNPAAWMTGGRKRTDKDIADRHALGREQISTYLAFARNDILRVWTLPDTGEPASEVEFREDFGGVEVLGYIDLIMQDPRTGALLVRDLKTGTKKPVGHTQLAVYRHAILKKYGVDARWGDYWMAKYGTTEPRIYLGDIPLRRIESRFQMMDFSERNGIYLPNVGDHCRSICDVARYCPDIGGQAPEGVFHLGT